MKAQQLKKIFSTLYINTNHDLKKTILVAGTGRSGTTWIANIINYKNDYRDIFEPFVPQYTKEWGKYRYKQYMRPDDERLDIIQAAKKILSGKIRNQWVDRYNRKFLCKNRVIKEIRVNFLLRWIKKKFPEIPIIFVMRHPCAVASSRMKLGWADHLGRIIEQEELVSDFFNDTIVNIRNCKSNFERQIYLWCMENYVPLRQFEKKEMYIVYYEHFCTRPNEEVKRLFNRLNINIDHNISDAIQKPSVVTGKHSAVLTGEDLVNTWRKNISKTELKTAIDILSRFGLDEIYDHSSLPKS